MDPSQTLPVNLSFDAEIPSPSFAVSESEELALRHSSNLWDSVTFSGLLQTPAYPSISFISSSRVTSPFPGVDPGSFPEEATTSGSIFVSVRVLRENDPVWYMLTVHAKNVFLETLFGQPDASWLDIKEPGASKKVAREALLEVYVAHIQLLTANRNLPLPESTYTSSSVALHQIVSGRLPALRTRFKKAAKLLINRKTLRGSGIDHTRAYGIFELHDGRDPTFEIIGSRARYWLESNRFLHSGATDANGALKEDYSHPSLYALIYAVCYKGVASIHSSKCSLAQGIRKYIDEYGLNGRQIVPFLHVIPDEIIALSAAAIKHVLDNLKTGRWNDQNFEPSGYSVFTATISGNLAGQRIRDLTWKKAFDAFLSQKLTNFLGGSE